MVGNQALEAVPAVRSYLDEIRERMEKTGIYPATDAIDLTATILQTVMNANLLLQVYKENGWEWGTSNSFSELAPEVLTLCSGDFDPFDFGLSEEQHTDLFLAGKLCVHLQAALLENEAKDSVMNAEYRLKTLLHCIHLKYPDVRPKRRKANVKTTSERSTM